jgi:hypothetical protein
MAWRRSSYIPSGAIVLEKPMKDFNINNAPCEVKLQSENSRSLSRAVAVFPPPDEVDQDYVFGS